jgi:hypothetical protein
MVHETVGSFSLFCVLREKILRVDHTRIDSRTSSYRTDGRTDRRRKPANYTYYYRDTPILLRMGYLLSFRVGYETRKIRTLLRGNKDGVKEPNPAVASY